MKFLSRFLTLCFDGFPFRGFGIKLISVRYSYWSPVINLESDIRSISYVKSNAAEILKQVNETHNPVVITQNGEARGVLVDPKSYQEMVDALEILKLTAAGERDIEEGRITDHQTTMTSLREHLQAKQAKPANSRS